LGSNKKATLAVIAGIVVLAGAWLYFGTFPLPHQLWGGVLTVAGVLIMTLAQARLLRWNRKS